MGHIANKIDAKDKKLSEILSGERYRVDSFQREYRWQRKHIEALISDLSISFLNNYNPADTVEDSISYDCYYMGPVVLCQDKNELSVVDGQQRLTSLTLLLVFLYHLQKKIDTDVALRDILSFLYVQKTGKRTLIINVDSRKKVMEHLIKDPEQVYEDINDDENESVEKESKFDESVINILSRYEDISTLFPEELKTDEILPLFVEWLLERVILVEVKAYSMENAYTIFETMNDRGMTLSPTEILKGYLLSNIKDDEKSEEANEFWKNRILEINRFTKLDADLDFFRAWLRAKYATSTRSTKSGAENEDFELIATQFNSWVKNNTKKVYLKESNDFYFFIVSDFNFYSELYIKLFEYKQRPIEGFEAIYVNNFYPIADSLYYPLILSSISKIDDEGTLFLKINLINKFVDIYTNYRVFNSKSITQSSIRYYIYELIKEIRNLDSIELRNVLHQRLKEMFDKDDGRSIPHVMNNWGYYHYFFARILHHLKVYDEDFADLLRSRKQSSLVLVRIFDEKDFEEQDNSQYSQILANALGNFCLIRRYHLDEFESKRTPATKIRFLLKNNYLPDYQDIDENRLPIKIIYDRDDILSHYYNEIWSFKN